MFFQLQIYITSNVIMVVKDGWIYAEKVYVFFPYANACHPVVKPRIYTQVEAKYDTNKHQ